MKHVTTAVFVALAAAFFAAPFKSFAQAPDTVWVPASPPGNINNFIMGDTTSSGARVNPNRVYELYDDSIYYYTGGTYESIIVNNYNLTLTAPIPAAGHFPPEINPYVQTNGSSTYWFITALKGNVTLDNIYLQGVRPDEGTGGSRALLVSGDSDAVFRVDNCVFDGWYFRALSGGGVRNKYFITNSKIINSTIPGGYFDGQGFGALDGAITDTLWMTDNTFFCNNSYIVLFTVNSLAKYVKFEHNTVFLTSVNPMWMFQAINVDIKNNIFYGTMAFGQTPPEVAGSWYDYDGQISSTIDFDTLANIASEYNLTEADRHINVMNNDYFWPKQMTDFWTHWDDSVTTAGAQDSEYITPPQWMNSRTLGMFGNKTMWPNFDSSGNINADPGFPSSATQQVDSLMAYVEYNRTGNTAASTYNWWYIPTDNIKNQNYGPFPAVWPFPWSLTYSNTALEHAGTDGKALGDLNWFPSQLPLAVHQLPPTVPGKFELSNNYPNPFNPSTTIKVSLPNSGFASLRIYNVLGQLVQVVDNGYKQAGSYTYNVNMDKYASGVYFYTLQQGSNILTKKMLLLK